MGKSLVADDPGREAGEYYVWSVPHRPVSVHLKLDLVDSLALETREALASMPRRGLEIGGLLLGRISNPNDGQYIVVVDAVDAVEIEHVRGPSYILSSSDREELSRRLRKHEKAKKGLEVVGFYRSHTRPGLFLDEYDFDLMRSYFAHPAAIGLLVRPAHDVPPTAGFFFWEEGEVHRSSSYRDFPLSAELLRARQPVPQPDATAPVASPLPETIASPPVIPSSDPAPQTLTLVPRAKQTVPPREPAESVQRLPALAFFKSPGLGWAAAAVLAVFAASGLWRSTTRPDKAQSYNLFGMNVEPYQSGMRLTWNRNSPLIDQNPSAKLAITDGAEEKELTLDTTQLKTGQLVYWPASTDVNFRLQLGNFSESLRAVIPNLQPKPPVAGVQPNQTPPAEAIPASTVTPTSQSSDTRSRTRQVKTAVLPGAPEPKKIKTPELHTPSAGEIASVPVRLERPTIPQRDLAPPPAAAAEVEPVKASGIKRVFGAIPGLFKKGKDEDGFVPAKAVRKFNPPVPPSVQLSEDTQVSVKVSLDESGRVKATDLVSRNVNTQLANAAMEAAKRWRFEPARLQDKNVASSVILHFRFNREGGGT